MKHLLSTTALALTLAFSGMAYANDDMSGKESHDGGPMQEAVSKLPEKDAAQFRATMKQSREQDKGSFEQARKLHGELHDILIAPKFDQSAFLAKSAELEKLHEKMHDHMTQAFAKALAGLSQDERKSLADSMHEERRERRPHHRDGVQPDNDQSYPDAPKQ